MPEPSQSSCQDSCNYLYLAERGNGYKWQGSTTCPDLSQQ